MQTSSTRILTTQVGSLPRSKAVTDIVYAKLTSLAEGAAIASRRLWNGA